MNLELLIGTVLLLVANGADISAEQDDMSLTNTSADITLKSIKQAEIAGADVSDLVKRFNYALDLLQQAEISDFRSCASYSDCIQKANTTFISITHDSELLREQAQETSDYQRIMSFALYAPLGAFTASIAGLYSFKIWKSYQVKKFLDMEIREKGN